MARRFGEEIRTMSVLLLSSTEDADSHASLIGLRSAGGHIVSITQDGALSAVSPLLVSRLLVIGIAGCPLRIAVKRFAL